MNPEDWEVGLIRAMLGRGDWTQQQIHAHFTRPDRDFHQDVIGKIRRNEIAPQVQPASDAALDDFLDVLARFSWPELAAVCAAGDGMYHVEYRFLPVGQGLFATGRLCRAGIAPFVWVYDCGTMTQTVRIEDVMDCCLAFPVATGGQKPTLNLLAISHFDVDHISGMVALLGRFRVDLLFLPYLTPWDRLALLLQSGAAAGSLYAQFLRDPIAFVREAGQVERIVLVRPGGEAPPPAEGGVPLPPDGLKKWQAKIPTLPPDGASVDMTDPMVLAWVEVLASGGGLTLNAIWEFVPYCTKKFSRVFDATFRAAAQGLADRFLANGDQASLDALKRHYQNALIRHGHSGSAPRNHISLHLYAGPVGPIVASPMWVRARVGMAPSPSTFHLSGPDNSRIGQLLTGDADFRMRAFAGVKRFYGPQGRLDRAGVFQVPHHGAQANWCSGNAAQLAPRLSVFSADDRQFGPGSGNRVHPNHAVWNDFACHTPVRTNCTDECVAAAVFGPSPPP